jgi:hypothetical protein
MIERPLKTCSKESCGECNIHSKITCHFHPGQFIRLYLILLPPVITGAIGINNYSRNSLIIWVMTFPLFFLLLGIRVLCTHCPHYEESSGILRCWSNWGVPKLWKYRPEQMIIFEKIILISGFIIVWGYPVIFISLAQKWILLTVYIFFVMLFFFLLNKFACRRCINFSCPLNRVSPEVKEEYFRSNSQINTSRAQP